MAIETLVPFEDDGYSPAEIDQGLADLGAHANGGEESARRYNMVDVGSKRFIGGSALSSDFQTSFQMPRLPEIPLHASPSGAEAFWSRK